MVKKADLDQIAKKRRKREVTIRKNKKKIILGLICLIITIFLKRDTFATEKEINILNNTDQDIPMFIMEDLKKQYPNEHIIINEFGTAQSSIQPRIVWFELIEKKTTATNVLAKQEFIMSVAKGATKQLSNKVSVSLSATPVDMKGYLSLGGTIVKEYDTTQTFEGPSENSPYNSRMYYVKFYEDRGTYYGRWATDMGAANTESGTWTSPKYYVEYSVDING